MGADTLWKHNESATVIGRYLSYDRKTGETTIELNADGVKFIKEVQMGEIAYPKDNLLIEAEMLITATVHKWGHNDICDCKRCQWLRRAVKVVDEIPIGKDAEAEHKNLVCPFCNGKFYLSEGGVANGNHEKAS